MDTYARFVNRGQNNAYILFRTTTIFEIKKLQKNTSHLQCPTQEGLRDKELLEMTPTEIVVVN